APALATKAREARRATHPTATGRASAARHQSASRASAARHPPASGAAQAGGAPASRRLAFEASELGAQLSPTPYMGWDTYFSFGGYYDEAKVLEQASDVVDLGLAKLGYRYIWLDAGWWQGRRNGKGEIEVSSQQWPRGIAGLAESLHAAGLKLGVYTDAGREGCGAATAGSYGHYQQDMNTLARWGVDAVKVDFCGGSQQHLDPRRAYTRIHQAIVHDRPHRPILLSVCDYLQPGILGYGRPPVSESAFSSYAFGPEVANSWRTETDVGVPGEVEFEDVLRNLDADAAHPEAAGPGHWNDPDYLGPGQGMSTAQFRTQFSMWSMLAAPLMVSENLAYLSQPNLETISNREVVAIDQDPAGVQGTLVSTSGEGQVWSKPLADGSFAVALLNRGGSTISLASSATAVGLPSAPSYEVRDLWAGTKSSTSGPLGATVAPYSTVLFRVYPKR
ncbi:MAG: glycoside hydrolase family 27 protein, partial [Solirubrobacteraceae bacterium]